MVDSQEQNNRTVKQRSEAHAKQTPGRPAAGRLQVLGTARMAAPMLGETPRGVSSVKLSHGVRFIAKTRPKVRPLLRTFELRQCQFVQLSSIDVTADSFSGQIYIELWCAGGANDRDLSAPGDSFPLDDAGKPTFRPPIRWYAAQMDFNNALSYSAMGEVVVKTDGDDIGFAMRYEGTWFAGMELKLFPFDSQLLKVSICMNTRTTGMIPAALVVVPSAAHQLRLEAGGFAPRQQWRMHPYLTAEPLLVGETDDRKFPSLNVSALVTRRPGFILSNIALPVGLFVPIAHLQFSFPLDDHANRVMVPVTMLLTAAAYKNSIATIVPQIPYLTLIDTYVMACS